jgi:hypothetical protein
LTIVNATGGSFAALHNAHLDGLIPRIVPDRPHCRLRLSSR